MEKYLIMAGACEPYNPHHCPLPEWEASINGIAVQSRKVWVDHDVATICKWITPGGQSGLAFSLSQHLTHLARSDYAQPYMLLADGQPIMQLEVVSNKYSELSLYAKILPDDYCLYVHVAPEQGILELQVFALHKMLQWFQAIGIWRLWTVVSGELPHETALILRAGFDPIKTIADKYETEVYLFAGHHK